MWMHDSSTWFWAHDGLYRTGDGGESWQHVYSGGASIGEFQTQSGELFVGGLFSLLRSADGIAWTSISGSPGTDFVTGSSTKIYAARQQFYHWASVTDPTKWSPLPTPAFPHPDYVLTWVLTYDEDHHILYSVNATNGFWRLATR
jgi:hypothetical protein